MSHSFSLISTLAIGFAIAWALGFLMERIKVPALVGYLLAGIIISPATPGFVGDVNIASELSEIGVMLLMFGVGLHFSMTDLIRVKNIAVPGAILQMGLATCLGAVLAHFWGWPWGQSIVFGMCLSCASTVVLLKGLESRGILESGDGQIAVGWLVVEDIMTVLILVLLPPLASLLGSPLQNTEASLPLWQIVGITLAQVFGFHHPDAGCRKNACFRGFFARLLRRVPASSLRFQCWYLQSVLPTVQHRSSMSVSHWVPSSPAW